MEELRNESKALESTLKRYLDLCEAVSSQYEHDDISDIILDELQVIASFEAYVDRSKKAIGRLRNSCGKVVPINKLPSELLAQIFCATNQPECAFSSKPHVKQSSGVQSRSPMPLMHVCSHWRSVASNSQALWTHVDIAPFFPNEQKLLERARLFASLSGDLPVGLHIKMGFTKESHCLPNTLEFCAAVAQRARFIVLSSTYKHCDTHAAFIGNLFVHSVPGMLRQLSVGMPSFSTSNFITPRDSPKHPNTPDSELVIEVSYRHLEEVLRCVTDLRLMDTYFHWTSQAYSGLVKLHIEDTYGSNATLSQLAHVLGANPRLRSFRFGSRLATERGHAKPAPVRLNDLELLYLDCRHWEHHSSLLQLIIPGFHPLRMTTRIGMDKSSSLTEGEHKRFFERSNIVQLHAGIPEQQPVGQEVLIPELLNLMPNLETLSLDAFYIVDQRESPLPADSTHSGARFTHLHLRRSAIHLEGLKFLVDKYPIARLTIEPKSCTVGNKYCGGEADRYTDQLLELYPNLELIDYGDPNLADWD